MDNREFQSYKATILLQSNPNIMLEFRLNSTLSTAQRHRKRLRFHSQEAGTTFNFKDTGQRSFSSYWLIIMSFKRRLCGFLFSKVTVQVCQLPARLVKQTEAHLLIVLRHIDEVFFLLSAGVSLKVCFSVLHAGFIVCASLWWICLIDYEIMESE